MNLTGLWIDFFGISEWFGIDIGFWFSMAICFIVVIVMNTVFWSLKPVLRKEGNENDEINT